MPAVQQLLGLAVLMAMGGGLTVWAVLGVARFEGRTLLPFAPRRPAPWSGWQTATAVLAFVLVPTLVLSGVHHAFGASGQEAVPESELLPLLIVDALTKVLLIVGLLVWLLASGADASDLGPRIEPADPLLGVAGFLALCVIVYPLQAALQQFGKLRHPVERVLAGGFDPPTLIGMIVVAVVVAPLVEEFLFRVVLQGWLEKFWAQVTSPPIEPPFEDARPEPDAAFEVEEPDAATALDPAEGNAYEPPSVEGPRLETPQGTRWFPIVVASLLFALLHAAAWPAPVPLFFLSLGLGYLYQRTHRLAPSVVMHATVNGVSVLMLAVQPLVQGG